MKTALVLVDVQNDYFQGGKMQLVGMEEAAKKSQTLLTTFRESGQPLFHIQHIMADPNAPFFVEGSEGSQIHEIVKPDQSERVIQKRNINGFQETILLEELRKAGAERLVICGAMSHMCIDATTRAASDLGFECVVAHDACATKDLEFDGKTIPAAEVHGSFMSALDWGYAKVIPTSEASSDT